MSIKYRRENTGFLLRLAGIAVVYLIKNTRNLTLKNREAFPSFPNSVKGRQAYVRKGNFTLMIEASLKTHFIKRQRDNDRSVQKESNKNTMTLTGKISITETSCHPLEKVNLNFILNTINLSPRYGRVIRVSGYLDLTGVITFMSNI